MYTSSYIQLTVCVHWPPNIPEPILDQILIQTLLLLQSHHPSCLQLLMHSIFLPRVAVPTGRKLKINSDVWLTVHRNSVWIRKTN